MLDEMEIADLPGLSRGEAERRLEEGGYNELPSARPRGFVTIAVEVAREPMFLLLIAAGSVYLALGDLGEALMLLSFVFVVMGITLYQERKTERALAALRDLSSPRALVIRDGEQIRIAGRCVVPGDVLVLAEGDRVPADAVLLWSSSLLVDESLLTGESAPVRKAPGPRIAEPAGQSEIRNPQSEILYSGTLVVRGSGVARVEATGAATELGKIGRALQILTPEETPLQRETGVVVRNVALIGLSLCILVALVYGATRGEWLGGLLAGVTMAMAILPEEFPVVLTIFLALGAWRLGQRNVLTRRVPVVETLGSATVLCVDKTGTLTLNRMRVRRLAVDGWACDVPLGCVDLPDPVHELVEFSILASQRDPFDPMERALRQLGEQALAETEHIHYDWRLVREYPLSEELFALSHVWESPEGGEYVIAAKGAPEAIAELCHLSPEEWEPIAAQVAAMAHDGLRVLGVARSSFRRADLPGEQHAFDFEFLGLVGLEDPVRPTAPGAIRECAEAGIRVVMITGDHPDTARSIARQVGLTPAGVVLTGPELAAMGEGELRERIAATSIFARVAPEQKLRLVQALKAAGEVVAMTGDGVNDAPALKAAHIGIAMGERGTDVAREAADLVLLDDDFSSIVRGVRIGRRIFDNLRKAMAYIFSVHVPIAGMSLLPVLFGLPLLLQPVHIVFLELIIDPACSFVFEAEAEEAGIMRRPPRRLNAPLFGRRVVGLSLLQGLSVLLILFVVYDASLLLGRSENESRALAFSTLIFANLSLIATNRSWSRTLFGILRTPNAPQWGVTAGTLAFLALTLYVPFLQRLFRFAPLPPADVALAVGAGVLSIVWFEVVKVLSRRAPLAEPHAV